MTLPSIEQRIADAIEDLKAEPTALVEIAAEYSIKPEALRIRFENSYGPVESYTAPSTRDIVAEAVERSAARFSLSPQAKAYVGKRFFRDGAWYRFVAWDGKRVHAISESAGKRWIMTGQGNFASIIRQLGVA